MSAGLLAQTALAVVAVLLIGWLGRSLARLLRQPTVMGELAVGLLAVPALLALTNGSVVTLLLPPGVQRLLGLIGNAGLALFLVGVAYELRSSLAGTRLRALGWVTVAALLPPLTTGVLVAVWVLGTGDSALRGSAPTPSFVVMLAVSLAVTAVPVLARILSDRGLTTSLSGRLSLSAAAAVDAIAWPLLAVAIGLASGSLLDAATALGTLVVGMLATIGCRWLLKTGPAGRFAIRCPKWTAIGIGIAAILTALLVSDLGLSSVFGAFLVGLAVPGNVSDDTASGWPAAVRTVSRAGLVLVPVFFVAAGLSVFAKPFHAFPWVAIVVVTLLAVVGKLGGGYLGARLSGHSRRTAVRVGALLNTRGLTELVALQAGFHAGILTASMFLVCTVMALVTTCLTGPLLSIIDGTERRALARPWQANAAHQRP
jgi:Kef-type K+ transport system membrane component KefB